MPRSGVSVLAILVVAGIVVPLPLLTEPQSHLLYVAAQCLALAGSWLCWTRLQTTTRRAWLLLLVGWSISGMTDVLRYAVHHLGLPTQAMVPGQVSAVVGFAVMGSAALMYNSRRTESATRALLLDTGVLMVGLATPLFALRRKSVV